jgi:hypothetical protein
MRAALLAVLSGLLLSACSAIMPRPGTGATYADCDDFFRDYAKLRPDAVNLAEWEERDWDRALRTWDKDGDGRIERAEWMHNLLGPAPADPKRAHLDDLEKRSWGQIFDKHDRGHKGYLERGDYPGDSEFEFRMHDRNHDGWVSRDECAIILPRGITLI